MTQVVSIRLNNQEAKAFAAYAEFSGESTTEIFKGAVMEKIEDWEDNYEANKAYREYLKNPKTVTHEEMMREFADL